MAREIIVKTTRFPNTSTSQLNSPSTPWDNFMTWIRTDLVRDEDFPTTKLIVHLHNKITVEAAHQERAIFPSCAPPHILPNPDLTSTPMLQLQTSGSQLQEHPQSKTKLATPFQSTSVARGSTSKLRCTPMTPIPSKTLPVIELTPLASNLALDIIKYEDVLELEDGSSSRSPDFENEDMDHLERMDSFLEDDKDDPDFCIPDQDDPLSTEFVETASTSDSSDDDDNSHEMKIKSKPTTAPPPVDFQEGISQECDLCGEVIPFAEIEDHLKSHNVQDYIVKCPNQVCPYVFSCSGKMRRHVQGNRALGTPGSKQCREAAIRLNISHCINCEVCNTKCRSGRLFGHSLRHEAKMKRSLSCPIPDCTERYALRQSMDEHLMTHDLRPSKPPSETLEQECSVCKLLIKVKDVAEHFKRIHEMEKVIPCKLCPFLFHDWESLLDHLYEHPIRHAGQPCFICDDTQVKFTSSCSLRKHYFHTHQKGKKYICEHCDKEFFGYRELSSHKTKVHTTTTTEAEEKNLKKLTITVSSFKCDMCPSIFRHNEHLTNHKIKMHQGTPLACKFCDQTFNCYSAMRRHIGRLHLGLVTSHRCEVESCTETFKNKYDLKRHMKDTHTPRSEGYICETCGKLFKTRRIVNQHKQRVHLGFRGPRSICETCGESFACSTTLRTHKLIHTEERPHSCTICQQAFRQKGVLKRHFAGS